VCADDMPAPSACQAITPRNLSTFYTEPTRSAASSTSSVAAPAVYTERSRSASNEPSAQTKKEGANFAPSSQGKLRNQTVAAKAILWNVEYSASYFFTVGMPSMNFATIFSICGYSSRL